jgi:TfoX/Sxy family transcriptional regulator of competence genes
MASSQRTVDFLVEQMAAAGEVHSRKMFGEYAVYCDGKVVALVCDDRLFVKPTAAGRARIDEVVEAAPYAGAKPHLEIPGEQWDEADWLAALIRATADALSTPKPKKRKG